jgi:hypothetical protein
MNWKTKAAIQNAIAVLPAPASYAAHYWLQRRFGSLRKFNVLARMVAGVEMWRRIRQLGHRPAGKRFFELGTGWIPCVPVALWLMGARKVVTVDLNPYLKPELLRELVRFVAGNREAVEAAFGELLDPARLDELIRLADSPAAPATSLLELCQIEYRAPVDAAGTGLPDGAVDYYVSYNVLEHVEREAMTRIFHEGNRIVKGDRLFVHRIDYSDHFSHSDRSISAINFLQFSDSRWDRYAGNRIMYMNRMRHDGYRELFRSCGHEILLEQPDSDPSVLELLRSGRLRPDKRFRGIPDEILAVGSAWWVTRTGS